MTSPGNFNSRTEHARLYRVSRVAQYSDDRPRSLVSREVNHVHDVGTQAGFLQLGYKKRAQLLPHGSLEQSKVVAASVELHLKFFSLMWTFTPSAY
jgi:hypothetical protein